MATNIFNTLKIKNKNYVIETLFVSNNEIRQLNKQHRGKDRATDVLSFPQKNFPCEKEQILGTIIIAPAFAKKENIDVAELFIHGLLHLLGFDHETNPKEWERIEKTINKVL
ncbi:rRNA maturation RNase YbeY [Candidatus Berkelbacteria bacterium CG08_land_8_20_14_0_20_39_8]|uniref:Endoribonuclease YbeY n=1 Tax=Candidatus Berkelbacteria bacterium CG08_land_8_20_14_0_20_39_8 TaxID=1974511 RepID=A0A2M6YCN2_9BACT|nr:MAG: rRNA maturation RNase YbeY [Candidatus Berkelbacteria bacterium CG08_land_8_20_14_0_20_39_8]